MAPAMAGGRILRWTASPRHHQTSKVVGSGSGSDPATQKVIDDNVISIPAASFGGRHLGGVVWGLHTGNKEGVGRCEKGEGGERGDDRGLHAVTRARTPTGPPCWQR